MANCCKQQRGHQLRALEALLLVLKWACGAAGRRRKSIKDLLNLAPLAFDSSCSCSFSIWSCC